MTTGSSDGGDSVSFIGHGFNGPDGSVHVSVGGSAATVTARILFSWISPFPYPMQSLTIKTPPGKPGLADVIIATDNGSVTQRNGFRYMDRRLMAGPGASALVLDERRNRLYVAETSSGDVKCVYLGSLAVTTLLAGGETPASTLTLSPDEGTLYVLSAAGRRLAALDLSDGITARSYDLSLERNGYLPLFAATSQGSVIVSYDNGAIRELDLATGELKMIPGMSGLISTMLLAGSKDGSQIYMTDGYLLYEWNRRHGSLRA